MKKLLFATFAILAFSLSLTLPGRALAQDLSDCVQNDTPAITALRESLKAQAEKVRPLLKSGVLGTAMDATLAVREPASVPIAERQGLSAAISAYNRDLAALHRERARACGHPEWETQFAESFAKRRLERMPEGRWIRDSNGNWSQKKAAQ